MSHGESVHILSLEHEEKTVASVLVYIGSLTINSVILLGNIDNGQGYGMCGDMGGRYALCIFL